MGPAASPNIFGLMYVSRSLLTPDTALTAIDQIMEQSVENNDRHGITGGLLYASSHFVQVIEGDEAAVMDLMGRIYRDPRHCEIKVLEAKPAPRIFGPWTMARIGDNSFVWSHVADLLVENPADARRHEPITRMRQLMRELAYQKA